MKGTCIGMCPEREMRSRNRHVLERKPFEFIKEYTRSAAGKSVEETDLRPAHVLVKTMDYLVNTILTRTDYPWVSIAQFAFDRIRAIRQDLVIQQIADETTIEILEKATRFYVIAGYKLRNSAPADFDPHINDTHTLECLKRLLVLYKHYNSSRKTEFEAYYLLFSLTNMDALLHALTLTSMFNSDLYQLSWKLALAAYKDNFVVFFRTLKKLPFLASCVVSRHVNEIRRKGLVVMNVAYSSKVSKYPLEQLREIFGFVNLKETAEFVSSHGITVEDDIVQFNRAVPVIVPSKTLNTITNIIQEPQESISDIIFGRGRDTQIKPMAQVESMPVTVVTRRGRGRGRGWAAALQQKTQEHSIIVGRGRGRTK